MKVLIACEESQTVCKEFRAKGHDAFSCDIQPSSGEYPEYHYQMDIKEVLYKDWDLLIAHPPCTYLANSGVRWLNIVNGKITNKERFKEMLWAGQFFRLFTDVPIKRKCIENPIPHKYAGIPKYTQIIQPWQFGHEQMKATCLWLYGLPLLKATNIVGPPPKDKQERYKWQNTWTASPGPERQKIRSKTFTGIAEAMAEQWG